MIRYLMRQNPREMRRTPVESKVPEETLGNERSRKGSQRYVGCNAVGAAQCTCTVYEQCRPSHAPKRTRDRQSPVPDGNDVVNPARKTWCPESTRREAVRMVKSEQEKPDPESIVVTQVSAMRLEIGNHGFPVEASRKLTRRHRLTMADHRVEAW
jgi:hypothetical protein